MTISEGNIQEFKEKYRIRKSKRYDATTTPSWTVLLDSLFLLLCCIGFLYQVVTICKNYFEYPTSTLVEIEMPEELVAPDVSICIRYVDLFSRESLEYLGLGHVVTNSSLGIQQIQNEVTVEEIFNMTRPALEMIGTCFLPQVQSYHVVEGSEAFCNEKLRIKKFYAQEYICYQFGIKVRDNVTYTYQNLAFSLSYPGLFYGLAINMSSIKGAGLCKIFAHEIDTLPFETLGYAPVFDRKVGDVEVYNMIKVGFTVTEIDLMAPPYDTNCRWYHKYDHLRDLCYEKCLNQLTLDALGKVPFSSIQDTPVPIKHVNNFDVLNESTAEMLDQMDHSCNRKCSEPPCELEHYTTYLQIEEKSDLDFFTVMLQIPTEPSINVTSTEKILLQDFIVYLTSTLATWFGISAITFSPLSFSSFLRRKQCSCRFCQRHLYLLKHEIIHLRFVKNSKELDMMWR